LSQRYYQHYLSLIADSPATEMAWEPLPGPPEAAPAQDSQDTGGQEEAPPALATDLAPIAPFPPLTSKPADAPQPAADQASSSSSPRPAKASRCFIATAAYGSPLAPEVLLLQTFRDEHLVSNRLGRCLIRLYSFLSPPLAGLISRREHRQTCTRGLLRPILLLLKHLRLTGK
jgi:hypothetical protein